MLAAALLVAEYVVALLVFDSQRMPIAGDTKAFALIGESMPLIIVVMTATLLIGGGPSKAEMTEMKPMGDSGTTRIRFRVPARGLFGYRSEFMTDTRGEGILHHTFAAWGPWAGQLRGRSRGVLVADRQGLAVGFALFNLQERATMFVKPGELVYRGMIVGENSRTDDMDGSGAGVLHELFDLGDERWDRA